MRSGRDWPRGPDELKKKEPWRALGVDARALDSARGHPCRCAAKLGGKNYEKVSRRAATTAQCDGGPWPRLIVFANPQIKIGLELVDRTIHLFAESDAVELVEHGLVEALADAVGLRALGLGPHMVDVLDGKIELVLVMLWIAAIFRAPIGQHPA